MQNVVIGRVSVRVMPDLKGFAQDTIRTLRRIEKSLPPIRVRVELVDEERIRRELQGLTRDRGVNINADLSGQNRFRAAMQSLLHPRAVKVEPEVDRSASARVRAMLRAMFLTQRVPIRTTLDKTSAIRTWTALRMLFAKRNVRIKPVLDKRAAAKVAAQIAATFSGSKFVRNIGKPITDAVKNMGTSTVPTFAAIVMAVNGLSAALLALSANALVIAQDLARIAPIMLPLPGIMAGFAIGIGASIAVLKDFNEVIPELGDQLGELQDKMSAQFWAKAEEPIRSMIDTLFPKFEKGILKVTDALAKFFGNFAQDLEKFLGFGNTMDVMFDRLAESIEIMSRYTGNFASIITNLGLIGSHYLPQLATWFGNLAADFAVWLHTNYSNGNVFDWIDRGIENLKALGTVLWNALLIFDGFADAARKAGGSTIQTLAEGLGNIAATVNSPGFQNGMVEVFAASLNMMERIGKIAGPSLGKMFAGFAENITPIFASIGNSIGFLLKTIGDAFGSDEFTEGFTNFLAGLERGLYVLSTAGGELGTVLGGLKTVMGGVAAGAGPLLAATLEALALIVEPLAETFAGLFLFAMTSLTNTIQMLSPLLPPIVTAFNGFLLALQPLAEAVLPVFQAVLQKVFEVLPGIIDAFTNLATKLTELWNIISPILIPVLEFLIDMLAGAVKGLIDGFSNVIEGITTILTNVIDLVQNVFAGNWSAAWENVKNILSGVLQLIWGAIQVWWNGSILAFFRGALLRLGSLWKGGWSSVHTIAGNFLRMIWNAVKNGWSKITGFFKDGGAKIASHAQAAWNRVKSYFTDAIASLKAKVQSWATNLRTEFQKMKTNATNKAREMWNSVKERFTNGVRQVVSKIKGLPGDIKSAFGDGSRILSNAGKAVIDGFVNALQAGFDRVKRKLGSLTNLLPSWKGPYQKDKTLLVKPGQVIIESLIDGFESRFGDVRKSLSSLTDEIGDMEIDGPTVGPASITRRRVMAALQGGAEGGGSHRTLNYYAAPGSSLGSHEDLFAALDRERAFGF